MTPCMRFDGIRGHQDKILPATSAISSDVIDRALCAVRRDSRASWMTPLRLPINLVSTSCN